MVFQAAPGKTADFLLITGDAWVDHPAFGAAVIARVLEAEGFTTAYIAQPDWKDASSLSGLPRPRLAGLVTSGNLDSMVANYTAARRQRNAAPNGGCGRGTGVGRKPDRACIVYTGLLKAAFPGLPVILGGLEASLRRFAHYDYWDDRVRRSILVDSGADILVYGMGERTIRELARQMDKGEELYTRGICFLTDKTPSNAVVLPSFEQVSKDKRTYAKATMLEYREHDPIRGRTLCQSHSNRFLVCTPPAMPLSAAELDAVAELPFTRLPVSKETEEIQFSLIHNRGCFGGCNFCSLAFHQGRIISSRSHASLLREAEKLTQMPGFKGYIHDVGGPTANFRHPACKKQMKSGSCPDRHCLTPKPCPNLDASHADYLILLQKLRALPGVKKVFVRSGIRYDYLMLDKSGHCMEELVKHHISGQLKVAPEHCRDHVLDLMNKPRFAAYRAFCKKYEALNSKAGKKQFLVPYLISSHPGSRLEDAVELALTLKRMGRRPEQVQDFYPTPGTISTCMYHTGLDPRTMKPVYAAKTPHEKAMQRALLQWFLPQNRKLVLEGLRQAGREDLIPVLLGGVRMKGKPPAKRRGR
ncbi:MAG: YgiQ family radical SAM protein [Oscillospiraceae bacterium]|nr:YgiQ family radical SAM protein [Oscillospiraceae bacterium]